MLCESTEILCSATDYCKSLPTDALHPHNRGMSWKEKLESALDARGISAAEVGRRLGIHRNTAANFFKPIKQGGSNVTPEVLWRLCQWAGVSADDVLDDSRPLTLVIDPTPRASGVNAVVTSRDETDLDAELVRQAKRHKERPEAPGGEPGAKPSGPGGPRGSRGPKKGKLRKAAVSPPEDKGPATGKR